MYSQKHKQIHSSHDGTSVPLRRKRQLKKRDGAQVPAPPAKARSSDHEEGSNVGKDVTDCTIDNSTTICSVGVKLPSISIINSSKLAGNGLLSVNEYETNNSSCDMPYCSNDQGLTLNSDTVTYPPATYEATFVQTIGNGTRIECSQVSQCLPENYVWCVIFFLSSTTEFMLLNFFICRRSYFQRWKAAPRRFHFTLSSLPALNTHSPSFTRLYLKITGGIILALLP